MIANVFAYWFPTVPQSDMALLEENLICTNIFRLRMVAWLSMGFMFILICIQLAYIREIQSPEINRAAPYIMMLRLIIIGGSIVFLIMSGLRVSQGTYKPFHHFLGSGFILFNLAGFAILSGFINSAYSVVASSYIMAVLVSATFLYLSGPESVFIYGLAWAVMGISVWNLQPDWIIAFSSFLNGSFATILALVISRVIYVSRVRDFLSRQMIELKKQELAASNQMLKHLSYIDDLTGIPNRRYFKEFLLREWKRSLRDQKLISLIMIDIDKFKAYNDTFGHLAGDSVIAEVAAALNNITKRPGDLVARYGGEEFVAVLPDTDQIGACLVADRMLKAVENLDINHPSCGNKRLTISLGLVCMAPVDEELSDSLVGAADSALYRAKEEGGNRYVIADGSGGIKK